MSCGVWEVEQWVVADVCEDGLLRPRAPHRRAGLYPRAAAALHRGVWWAGGLPKGLAGRFGRGCGEELWALGNLVRGGARCGIGDEVAMAVMG